MGKPMVADPYPKRDGPPQAGQIGWYRGLSPSPLSDEGL